MPSTDRVDTPHLAVSVVLLGLLAVGTVFYPTLTFDPRGPVSYLWTVLLVAVLATSPYRPFRESWWWNGLFAGMVGAWGLHNVAGPDPLLVMGYGFVLLGAGGIAYTLYDRVSTGE